MSISFRDPAGRVRIVEGRVLRLVSESGASDIDAALASAAVRKFVDAGRIVGTKTLDAAEAAKLLRNLEAEPDFLRPFAVLEHEKIPFRSFPYEWPAEMLHAAGSLTLDLAEASLSENLGLKDATPYNILFRGTRPVFVDLLSFERREPTDTVWLPYAQFVRSFLLPLLVNAYFGIPLKQIFTTNRDGLQPEAVYRMCSPLQKLRPPFLTLVTLPSRLNAARTAQDDSIYRQRTSGNAERARFVLQHQFKGLRRHLDRLAAVAARSSSSWSNYMEGEPHLTQNYLSEKQTFVEAALKQFGSRVVLDVGANTGHFSRVAARGGARVVAVDADEASVGEIFRAARAEESDILPLVLDITRPSPATGWRNRECASFLERARGSFDAVLMLAVSHHLLVSEMIPLEEIVALASEMTTKLLVVEFVGTHDPMFRRLTRGREHLFDYFNREVFEAAFQKQFRLVRSRALADSGRWLYLYSKSESE